MSYDSRMLALSPGAHWICGEASGNLADSANANTMVANGAPGYGAPGPVKSSGAKAITLNGNAANYFEAANDASIDMADVFSIVAIVKPVLGSIMCVYTRGTNGPDFRVDATGHINLTKSFVISVLTSTGVIDAARYHQIAVTKNGLNSTKLYIDGLQSSGADASGVAIAATAGVSQIGRSVSGNNLPWNGAIGRVSVFKNVELTAAQMLASYLDMLAMVEGRRRRR